MGANRIQILSFISQPKIICLQNHFVDATACLIFFSTGKYGFVVAVTTIDNIGSGESYGSLWQILSQSYNRELQRQRCKNLQRN
jgi:hypothetical protein